MSDAQVSSQEHTSRKNPISEQINRLIGCYTSLNLCWPGLDGQTVKNVPQPACKVWSWPKWAQAIVSQRSCNSHWACPIQTESQVDSSFQLSSICSIWSEDTPDMLYLHFGSSGSYKVRLTMHKGDTATDKQVILSNWNPALKTREKEAIDQSLTDTQWGEHNDLSYQSRSMI